MDEMDENSDHQLDENQGAQGVKFFRQKIDYSEKYPPWRT